MQKIKTNLIIGLGKTGMSIASFFKQKNIDFMVLDTRSDHSTFAEFEKLYPNVPFCKGGLQEEFFAKADTIFLSPGVPLADKKLQYFIDKYHIKISSDIELFTQYANAPIVAITGSNAKSTVTTLVYLMAVEHGLRAKVGGNIGTAALEILDENVELYVLELSSFQLETLSSLKDHIAVCLNVTEDHMDRYRDLLHYKQTKFAIFRNAKSAVVFEKDIDYYQEHFTHPQEIAFGLQNKNNIYRLENIEGKEFIVFNSNNSLHEVIATKELKIKGKHNILNVLAALTIGYKVGFKNKDMANAVAKFIGLPHRCQFVKEINGVSFYNDSKATNVGATIASLNGLGEVFNKIILILGGVCKGASFQELNDFITKYARAVILIGKDAPVIERDLQESKKHIQFYNANNMKDVIDLSLSLAKSNDAVLLAPACASFDSFKNFEHRGDVFMQVVNDYK